MFILGKIMLELTLNQKIKQIVINHPNLTLSKCHTVFFHTLFIFIMSVLFRSVVVLPKGSLPSTLSMISANYQDSR